MKAGRAHFWAACCSRPIEGTHFASVRSYAMWAQRQHTTFFPLARFGAPRIMFLSSLTCRRRRRCLAHVSARARVCLTGRKSASLHEKSRFIIQFVARCGSLKKQRLANIPNSNGGGRERKMQTTRRDYAIALTLSLLLLLSTLTCVRSCEFNERARYAFSFFSSRRRKISDCNCVVCAARNLTSISAAIQIPCNDTI